MFISDAVIEGDKFISRSEDCIKGSSVVFFYKSAPWLVLGRTAVNMASSGEFKGECNINKDLFVCYIQ